MNQRKNVLWYSTRLEALLSLFERNVQLELLSFIVPGCDNLEEIDDRFLMCNLSFFRSREGLDLIGSSPSALK